MQKDKILSMLGLARRAGRLSMGHAAAIGSIRSKKAKLVLVCAEISQGTKKDIEFTINKFSPRTPVAVADIGVDEIYFACGYKAGVIAVEDENFSNKIVSLLSE